MLCEAKGKLLVKYVNQSMTTIYEMDIGFCTAVSSLCTTVSGSLLRPKKPASVAQLDAPSDWRPGGRGFNPR